jgi:hypothetical protein
MMRVLYVQYTNPGAYPPLVRGARMLVESGAEVLMLGTRVRDTDALNIQSGNRMTVRLTDLPPDGWRLKAHYGRYAAWAAREASAGSPIGSTHPICSPHRLRSRSRRSRVRGSSTTSTTRPRRRIRAGSSSAISQPGAVCSGTPIWS